MCRSQIDHWLLSLIYDKDISTDSDRALGKRPVATLNRKGREEKLFATKEKNQEVL